MKRSIWRGSLVAATVGALIVGLVPGASAAPLDPDPGFVPDLASVSTYRIAGNTRIETAIEASQSRAWGRETGLVFTTTVAGSIWQGQPADPTKYTAGDIFLAWDPVLQVQVPILVVAVDVETRVDIIIARDDDFADALVASPLADVLNAPVLLNPSDELNDDVADEIARLAGSYDTAVVHLLGGTAALSAEVQDDIDALPGVDFSLRYQGINRYQTAVTIGAVTIGFYGTSGLDLEDVNVYLTTGENFPDALSAGAAAAQNDGVVLLTAGNEFDNGVDGFTWWALTFLDTWVPSFDENTPEIFAVGGPSVEASTTLGGVTLGDCPIDGRSDLDCFNGINRYETATLVADGVFPTAFGGDQDYFAVASGTNYPDAVVASAYISNADGPLLLSAPNDLLAAFGDPTGNPFTAAYLQSHAANEDVVFVFGGTGSLTQHVQSQIDDIINF